LPNGFVVRLNRSVHTYDGGRTLVGGSPTTVVRLKADSVRLLEAGEVRVRDATSRVLAERLLDLAMADPVLHALSPIHLGLITVVVPAHGRPRQLDLLLSSVPSGVPVVVVDDCSQDPASVAAVVARHGAALVRHDVNRGPAAARNTGLRLVRTPFVAFVDSDVVLEPDTLSILLRHFHDGQVALTAPRILGRHPTGAESWVTRYENARASLDLGSYPALVMPRAPVAWVPSACLVGRVDALGGGFDEDLQVAEDVDLVWRLWKQGSSIRYDPSAAARHEHRAELRDWGKRKMYYGTGAHLLAERHGMDVAPAVLSPWAAVFAAAVLIQRRWSMLAAALVLLGAWFRIRAKVGTGGPTGRIAFRLTASGAAAALSQTSALMLRHWWPLALAGGLFSRRLRRAMQIAALVDTALERQRVQGDLDPVRFAAARRLDDLSYGAGVWLGAWRHRSIASLLPDLRLRNR